MLRINKLKEYFNIDRMQIGRPIILSDIYVLIDDIDGVQTVIRPGADGTGGLQFNCKVNGNYSSNYYDIKNATRNGIIYPPKDPSIFEIKYPDVDIRGKVVPLF